MCNHGDTVNVLLIQSAKVGWQETDTPAYVRVDRCIAPIVDALNRLGVRTTGACCGHGTPADPKNGEILLLDGRVLVVEPDRSQLDERGRLYRESLAAES